RASDGPLPGREDHWSLVTQHRVLLAREARQWGEAERLQLLSVEWDRKRAAPFLAVPPADLDDSGRHAIRTLAASVEVLGDIQRETGKRECVKSHEEGYELAQRISDRAAAAACALNLGHAYKNLPALRDLDKAERWYQKSLKLSPEADRLGRARSTGQ